MPAQCALPTNPTINAVQRNIFLKGLGVRGQGLGVRSGEVLQPLHFSPLFINPESTFVCIFFPIHCPEKFSHIFAINKFIKKRRRDKKEKKKNRIGYFQ